MARLDVVPMGLEARGLDVEPNMIEVFERLKDICAVEALEIIYSKEVGHVTYGAKWFYFLCGRNNQDPKKIFHSLVHTYLKEALKLPFNEEKRACADIPQDFYWPLADELPLPTFI